MQELRLLNSGEYMNRNHRNSVSIQTIFNTISVNTSMCLALKVFIPQMCMVYVCVSVCVCVCVCVCIHVCVCAYVCVYVCGFLICLTNMAAVYLFPLFLPSVGVYIHVCTVGASHRAASNSVNACSLSATDHRTPAERLSVQTSPHKTTTTLYGDSYANI